MEIIMKLSTEILYVRSDSTSYISVCMCIHHLPHLPWRVSWSCDPVCWVTATVLPEGPAKLTTLVLWHMALVTSSSSCLIPADYFESIWLTFTPALCSFPDIPEVKNVPQSIACTPTSVTVEFLPSIPAAAEYRIEYTKNGSIDYEEGKRLQYNNQSSIKLTQGGLQPDTRYSFRIVPYLHGIRGLPSPLLNTSTSERF